MPGLARAEELEMPSQFRRVVDAEPHRLTRRHSERDQSAERDQRIVVFEPVEHGRIAVQVRSQQGRPWQRSNRRDDLVMILLVQGKQLAFAWPRYCHLIANP